jgi:hypothetical protein
MTWPYDRHFDGGRMIPRAPAAFGVNTVSGLQAWWRADKATASSWADKSGNGYDLAQGTADNQPAVVSGGINGKPVVRFGGNDYLFRSDDLGIFNVTDQAFTSFIVYEHSGRA